MSSLFYSDILMDAHKFNEMLTCILVTGVRYHTPDYYVSGQLLDLRHRYDKKDCKVYENLPRKLITKLRFLKVETFMFLTFYFVLKNYRKVLRY